jgi:hypothetical protein
MVKIISNKGLLSLIIILLILVIGLVYYFYTTDSDSDDSNSKKEQEQFVEFNSSSQKMISVQGTAVGPEDRTAVFLAFDNYSLLPSKVFSFHEWYMKNKLKVSKNAQSAFASTLYELAIRSGLEIGERHIHLQLPTFSKPGFDVEIKGKEKDFSIRNPYRYAVIFKVTIENQTPILQLFKNDSTEFKAPLVTVDNKVIPFDKVMLTAKGKNTLSANLSTVGANGAIIKVFVTPAGKTKQFLARDYYPPRSQTVVNGAAAPAKSPPISNDNLTNVAGNEEGTTIAEIN